MKTYRKLISLSFCMALFGCNSSNGQKNNLPKNDSEKIISESSNSQETINTLQKSSMENVESTKYYHYVDPNNGLVQARYPLPKSWTVNPINAPIFMEGPQELKVYKMESESYAWSNDPMMRQTLQMSGTAVGAPMRNQQILQQVLKPNAQAQGYSFIKSYELPEVAGFWQRLFNGMPYTNSQRGVEVLGTEWKTPNGTQSFILMVNFYVAKSQTINWTIQTTEMEALPSYFDEAIRAYTYSYANAELNPQWIQYMNGKLVNDIQKSNQFWAQATKQSTVAHQQRMNAIAAAGTTNKSIGDTYSDILDISHKGYLNRSNINDAGHSKTIWGINETTMIGNHETGEHYNVPMGSNYYWVSNDGMYIGTDNALFNPNTERGVNEKNWTKFAVEQ